MTIDLGHESVMAAAGPRSGRRNARRRSLPARTAAPIVLAAAPLVVAATAIVVRRPRIDWTGDRALTELAVREAASFHQLLGMGGRFGWHHPGPLWMYLLLPGYELTGHAPWSLSIGVLAVHIAMVVIAVAVAARAGGVRAATVVSALIAVYLLATGLVYWTNLWAGYAFAWPLLAMIVVAAVGAADARAGWAIPAAALLGTLLVQTDVSTVVAVTFVGAVAVGVRARRFGVRRFVAGGRGAHSAGTTVSPSPVVLVALVVVAWIPPVAQQVSGNPGNLTLLVRFARQGAGGYPLRTSLATVGAALSVVPLGAHYVLRSGVQARLGAGPWWAVGWAVAYLGGTAATAAIAWKRGRRLAGDLAALSLAGLLAAVVSISRIDGPINFYLLTWITVLPVPALAAVVLTFAPTTRRPRAPDPVALGALGVAAVVALTLIVTQGTTHDWDKVSSARVRSETALVTTALGAASRGLVRVHVVTPDTWQDAAGVALQLERAGGHIEVDRDWVFLFGDAFRPRAQPPSAEVWFARSHELPDVTNQKGAIDLGAIAGIDILARRNR